MMNQQIKEKWVAALRSGEYKQGTQQLKTRGGKYCCLGVLCELYSEEHPTVKFDENGYILDESMTLPPEVQKWAELNNEDNPVVTVNKKKGTTHCLSTLNDGNSSMNIRKHSFKRIASLIEAQL